MPIEHILACCQNIAAGSDYALRLMSGWGQSATSRFVRAESVLASTPDIGEPDWHVSAVPNSDIGQIIRSPSSARASLSGAASTRIEPSARYRSKIVRVSRDG